MASRDSDSSPKLRLNLLGEGSIEEGLGSLWVKIGQLQKQIQAERAFSVKEKLEMNQKKLESHVSELISEAMGKNGPAQMLSSRIANPISKYSGFIQRSGDKDYINSHEVVSSTTIKLPHSDKLPPYTTWIFLDRNQRMAEDQSVVGRRQIYYDEDGSEALICSDSDDEITEPEEEKHDFLESEDRILWMAFQEYGLGEEVVDILSQFIGGTRSEMQERCNTLKEKYDEKRDQKLKVSGESGLVRGTLLNKTLSAALDSLDNLFCRRCMIFDCRLHGCSQSLINPSEKHSNWSEHEEDRKPCSDQCYLQLRFVSDLPSGTNNYAPHTIQSTTLEGKGMKPASANPEEQKGTNDAKNLQEEICISKKITHAHAPSETISTSKVTSGSLHSDGPVTSTPQNESTGKRKITDIAIRGTVTGFDDSQDVIKKQKVPLDLVPTAGEVTSIRDHLTSAKGSIGDKPKHTTEPEFKQLSNSTKGKPEAMLRSSEWKPIEKELYLKGIEIFGRNSCLIARNLLSGLKSCKEISRYMHHNGASTAHRSVIASSSLLDGNGEAEMDNEQENPTRTRVFRRKGKARKLKYSWKSAGHPSIWKRIADGKNRSCKQYTPCGCESVCGKQCPCQHNGTCCEKYCGCSKTCKNRFRGCHCAKSQCRSRQCPCFAAGRECDPDVCRNCWVSCGDGSLGEPPRRGEGQCGNMRLLLRQQQRILLGRSDVAGWGAFLKNPVNKNDYLGEYTGELISQREADKRGKIYDRANSSFLFDLNDQYVLDAYRKGDKLKFANHSSNPNCYAKVMLVAGDHRVGIFAKEHIEASEELFYDYRYGPDQAPIWARKPEGSKRDDSSISQGRAKKHQSH